MLVSTGYLCSVSINLISGLTPTGAGDFTIVTVNFRAENAGTAEFKTDPADDQPLHESAVQTPPGGGPVQAVNPLTEVRYNEASLTITAASPEGEFHNTAMPLDVNGDGQVSPIDVLMLINDMNQHGPRQLVAVGGGEGEDGPEGEDSRYFPDVNNDGALSPIDALHLINYLNDPTVQRGGQGEGEAAPAGLVVQVPAALPNLATGSQQDDEAEGEATVTLLIPPPPQRLYGPAEPVDLIAQDQEGEGEWLSEDLLEDVWGDDLLDS